MGCSLFKGVNRRTYRGIAGNHHDLGVRSQLLYRFEELDAVQLFHFEIGQDQLEFFLTELVQSIPAVCGGAYLIAFLPQHVFQVRPGYLFVVHHQDIELVEAAQSLYGQVFEDSFLYVFQSIVLQLKICLRLRDIQVVVGKAMPGKRDEELKITHPYRVFGNTRVHSFKPVQLSVGQRRNCLRYSRSLSSLAKIDQLAR